MHRGWVAKTILPFLKQSLFFSPVVVSLPSCVASCDIDLRELYLSFRLASPQLAGLIQTNS